MTVSIKCPGTLCQANKPADPKTKLSKIVGMIGYFL